MDQARNQGQDIMLDTYPYLPGSTTLAALMPSWASSGGPTATLERLRDPEVKERIRVDMEDAGCDGGHGVPMGWSMIEVSGLFPLYQSLSLQVFLSSLMSYALG